MTNPDNDIEVCESLLIQLCGFNNEVRCTKHYTITIHRENYFVMWNFQEDITISEHNDPEQLDSIPINQNDYVTNTLPFKVMGVPTPKTHTGSVRGCP